MSTEILWFYESSGEQRGPITATELLGLHQRGRVGAESLVWRNGLNDWITLASSELGPDLTTPSGPPPLPRLAPACPPPVPVSTPVFVPRTVRLRPDFHPSIRSCYGRAWDLLTSRFWPFIGCFALLSVILIIAYQFFVMAIFLTLPVVAGFYWYTLRLSRGQTATFEMIFEGFRRQFGALAIANLILSGIAIGILVAAAIVFGLATAGMSAVGSALDPENPLMITGMVILGSAGLFTLIFPLLVLGFVGNFATIILMEGQYTGREALSLGWEATRPHWLKIGLFCAIGVFLTYAGMLALVVGAILTGAWSTIASVYLYEDAFGEDQAGVAGEPLGFGFGVTRYEDAFGEDQAGV
jgi:hypothetical protein